MLFTVAAQFAKCITRRRNQLAQPINYDDVPDMQWNSFLQTKPMRKILHASSPRHLRSLKAHDWQLLAESACLLWGKLETEGLLSFVPTAYPTLCLLLKGHFYFSYCDSPQIAITRIFEEQPIHNLLHAAASFHATPDSFLKEVLEHHKNQLLSPIDGKTPLHLLCTRLNANSTEHWIRVFLELCQTAARLTDHSGRLPFHHACESGITWSQGLSDLLKATPYAAVAHINGRSPFQLAVIAYEDKSDQEDPLRGTSRWSATRRRRTCQDQTPDDDQQVENQDQNRSLDQINTLFRLLLLDPTVVADLV